MFLKEEGKAAAEGSPHRPTATYPDGHTSPKYDEEMSDLVEGGGCRTDLTPGPSPKGEGRMDGNLSRGMHCVIP
jgi:hypothetical protein